MQDNSTFAGLDLFLSRRYTPAVPEGLSERILAAAARAPRNLAIRRGNTMKEAMEAILRDMQGLFFVPRPALVLSSVLVMGLSFGVYADDAALLVLPGVTTDEISSFMSIEDRFVASDFLSGGSL